MGQIGAEKRSLEKAVCARSCVRLTRGAPPVPEDCVEIRLTSVTRCVSSTRFMGECGRETPSMPCAGRLRSAIFEADGLPMGGAWASR
jgi:hypothetical protein